MALQVTNLQRSFIYKKDKKEITLSDPNENMSPQEVVKFHLAQYPELTNAIVEGPKVEGKKAVYNVTTKAGQLG